MWRDYIRSVIMTQYAFKNIDFYKIAEVDKEPVPREENNPSLYVRYPKESLTKFFDIIGYDIERLQGDIISYYDAQNNEYVIATEGLGGFSKKYYCEFVSLKDNEKDDQLIVEYREYNLHYTEEEKLYLKKAYLNREDNKAGYTIDKIETINEYDEADILEFVDNLDF